MISVSKRGVSVRRCAGHAAERPRRLLPRPMLWASGVGASSPRGGGFVAEGLSVSFSMLPAVSVNAALEGCL